MTKDIISRQLRDSTEKERERNLTVDEDRRLRDVEQDNWNRILDQVRNNNERICVSSVINAMNEINSDYIPDNRFQKLIPLKPKGENLPGFPTDCLPKTVADYVKAVAEHSQTSEDMAAVMGLGVLASCLQGKYQIEGTTGYTEPLNLYTVVIAAPGERKSSVLRSMTSCLEEYERLSNERLTAEIRTNKKERESIQRRITALTRQLENKPDPMSELELQHLQDELEDLPIISSLRYTADDCSSEALTSLLANNNGRMTVLSSEGGIFDIMAGRYSQKANLDVWLKGHCGDPIRVDRTGRETEYISNPALTAILSIQPSVLNEIMNNTTMMGRGLIARFLYSQPASRIGSRVFSSKAIEKQIEENYRKLVFELMDIQPETSPVTLKLDLEALREIEKHFQEHERSLNTVCQEFPDWANKYIGTILRIAALLQVADEGAKVKAVTGETMKKAIEIGKYFLAHAKYAYGLMGTDITHQKAIFVLNKIKEQQIRENKRSEIFYICRGKFFKKTEEIYPVLDLLEEHGYIRQERPEKKGDGGRPADVRIYVNPIIYRE